MILDAADRRARKVVAPSNVDIFPLQGILECVCETHLPRLCG